MKLFRSILALLALGLLGLTGASALDGPPAANRPLAMLCSTPAGQAACPKLLGFYSPLWFGAAGNGTGDDSNAITAMFSAISNLPFNNAFGLRTPVNGGGLTYATSKPLTVPPHLDMSDFTFLAIAGSSWDGSSQTGPTINATTYNYGVKGVLTIPSTDYDLAISEVDIDCNQISGCQGIYLAASNNINFDTIGIRHWGTVGNGFIVDAGGSFTMSRAQIFEWMGNDANFGVQSAAHGMAVGLFAAYDSLMDSGSSFGQAAVPLYVGPNANMNRFLGVHIWQSVPGAGVVWTNPLGVVYDGYRNDFLGTYLDSCPFLIRTTATTTPQGSQAPQITISNTVSIYQSTASTFADWLTFTTSIASTNTGGINLDKTNLWDTNTGLWSFTTSGAGSWSMGATMLSRLNTEGYGDSSIQEPSYGASEIHGNIDLLGAGSIKGHLSAVNSNASTSYGLTNYDTGQLLLLTASSGTVAVTVNGSTPSGLQADIYLSGHAGTIQGVSGSSINGVTTTITLLQNKLYHLVCYSSAACGLSGSGI